MSNMVTTYFYDSDLFGGESEHCISSSILIGSEKVELEHFFVRWKEEIENVNNGSEEDVFLSLLLDLSLKLRGAKSFSFKLLLSDSCYYDFMYFIMLLTKDCDIDKDTAIHIYNLWLNYDISEKIDKSLSLGEVKNVVHSFMTYNKDKEEILGKDLKISDEEWNFYLRDNSIVLPRQIENRISLYVELLRLVGAEIYVPQNDSIKNFSKACDIVAEKKGIKNCHFIEVSNDTAPNQVLSFLVRNINLLMDRFVETPIDKQTQIQKQAISLVWSLWLGTTQKISLIPVTWYEKYRELLKELLAK